MPKIKAFSIYKRTFPYMAKYKGLLIVDLSFAVIASFCEIICPNLLKSTAELVSKTLINKNPLPINLIIINAIIFLILDGLEIIGIYYMNYIGHLMGAKIETDMRRDLFSHIQKLDINYFNNTKIGQLLSRFTHDLSKITEFMHHLPEQLLIGTIKLTMSTIIVLRTNFYVGLVILIAAPIMFFTCRYYNLKLRRAFKKNMVQLGDMNSQIENSLLGVHITKSFANEQYEEQKFETENIKTYYTKKELYKNIGMLNGVMRFFIVITCFMIGVVGIQQMVFSKFSLANFLFCFIYVKMFLQQIITLLHSIEKYQEGNTPIIRFFEILDAEPTIKEVEKYFEKTDEKKYGKIEFKNVYFKYGSKAIFVIKNVNLTINKGEKVAIIGPSGAGKTTLCSLIQRFYDVSKGEILIDGVNIKNLPLSELHKIVGVVEQNVYMFPGTIYENILYGNITATKEEIIEAAKNAGLYNFIESLPNKFETSIGERGLKLSGGQKQRISIARMFLKKPSILIFDEATSSLDPESENIIKNSMNELSKEKTTIIIAHRLSTIRAAKKIIVLKNGEIEAEGCHNELIKNNYFYKIINDIIE